MNIKFSTTEVEILDTTLRDGSQARGISFTLQDKVNIALKLDAFGIHIIEGGWPGSNPKDMEFFDRIRDYSLKKAEIAVFGSTRRKNIRPEVDGNLQSLLKSESDIAIIFGKAWDLHVEKVLRCNLEENLEMTYDSIVFLRENGFRVYYDAEHFYDGFKRNQKYALDVLKAAEEAKAQAIVLCDTNGGCLPNEINEITRRVAQKIKTRLGIHAHNDSGCGVANSLMAFLAGAPHIQGTINGIGERTGNADLCQIIPNLELKLGVRSLKDRGELYKLMELSNYVNELAGISSEPYQPYTGKFAFAHKAGMHVDAVLKAPEAYEHVDPSMVGNERILTVSELSGKANIIAETRRLGLELDKRDARIAAILDEIKELEFEGYSLDNADATIYLIIARHLGMYKQYFTPVSWKVYSADRGGVLARSNVAILVNGERVVEEAEGVGPVHAQDLALRQVLTRKYPEVKDVLLISYKVTTVGEPRDTASTVRVFIEFSDGKKIWATTSASTNILEASIKALVDGYDYYLQSKTD